MEEFRRIIMIVGMESVIPAAFICLVRFNNIQRSYRPFVFVILAALVNENVSLTLVLNDKSNAISSNIFVIVEALLWLAQFSLWEPSRVHKKLLLIIGCLLLGLWIYENIILLNISIFRGFYLVAYSSCMVFLAVNQVNKMIVKEKHSLLRNSKFLICSGMLIFFTYLILVESFFIFGISHAEFLKNVYFIMMFVNMLVNIIFAIAAYLIPARQRFAI